MTKGGKLLSSASEFHSLGVEASWTGLAKFYRRHLESLGRSIKRFSHLSPSDFRLAPFALRLAFCPPLLESFFSA